jgi:hypothetical protein
MSDVDQARRRGDLSALKKRAPESAPKPARIPHYDSDKIVTNRSADEWALSVLRRKQQAGETLDAQQLATLERLSGSSGGGGSSSSSSSSAVLSSSKVVVVGKGGEHKGRTVRVVGGGSSSSSGGGTYTSKKFGGGGAASAPSAGSGAAGRRLGAGAAASAAAAPSKPLSTTEKLGMSLEDLAKRRGK